MQKVRRLLVAALLLVGSACGGDTAGTGSSASVAVASTSATSTTVGSTSTGAGTSSLVPSTTAATATTGAATTTAAATTSTLPADAHPVLGVSWADTLPEPGETAVYSVDFLAVKGDLPAMIEHDVAFGEGSYTRFTFGVAEPGNDGLAFYFDLSEPWVVAFAGLESYRIDVTTGPETTEAFPDPMIVDFLAEVGETQTIVNEVSVTFGSQVFISGVTTEVTLRTLSGEVTTPAGTFSDTAIIDVAIGGEFMGGNSFPAEFAMNPSNLLLRSENGSGEIIELIQPWG